MHCIQHSRGRILFEVICAFVISASCVGAWMQTGASSFLPAGLAVALYGLWHLTDMAGNRPAVAGDASTEVNGQGDLLEYLDIADPRLEAVPEIEAAKVTEAAKPDKPEAPRDKPTRKASGGRKARKQVADVVLAVPEAEDAALVPDDEAAFPPPTPLFEPEPFVRQQQRALFGRKAG